MFQQFRDLFFGTPPLAAVPSDAADIDAGDDSQFANLPSEDDSLADRSRKLNYRNWLKPKKIKYIRFSDLPPSIKAEATDGSLPPWRLGLHGEPWYQLPIDDDSHDAVNGELREPYQVSDDPELAALDDELAALDAEIERIPREFHERCEQLRAELRDNPYFLPHQDWSPSDD